jgi:hypothetical protein
VNFVSFPCCLAHTRQPLGYASLALCRVRARLMSVLLDQRPSLLTLRQRFPRLCSSDSLVWYYSAVRHLRDVHAGRAAIAFSRRPVVSSTPGISKVSRFSCMEFLDVLGVYDYAGPPLSSRYRSWACCLPLFGQRRRPDCRFSKLNTQPIYTPVYASVDTSQCRTQKLGAEWIAAPFS